jgi:hypothetical protein
MSQETRFHPLLKKLKKPKLITEIGFAAQLNSVKAMNKRTTSLKKKLFKMILFLVLINNSTTKHPIELSSMEILGGMKHKLNFRCVKDLDFGQNCKRNSNIIGIIVRRLLVKKIEQQKLVDVQRLKVALVNIFDQVRQTKSKNGLVFLLYCSSTMVGPTMQCYPMNRC